MSESIVSVRPCAGYEPEQVEQAMAAILEDLGGLPSFLGAGRNVLVKPNLLFGEPPEKAVTTHPEVVRAVVAAFRAGGAAVLVGDSPGFGSCRGAAERSGVAAAAKAGGGRLARFDETVYLGPGTGRRFPVAREVSEAELLVNLPKLKTHGMMTLTGAVKNLFGCVTGLRKPAYHMECSDKKDFAGLLLELAAAVAPALSIVDAVVVMDGQGPRHGRQRPMGLLFGSRDPLALDFVAAELAGVPFRSVPYLRLAMSKGLPAADPANRRLVGMELERARLAEPFLLPSESRSHHFNLPNSLVGLARRGLTARPSVGAKCLDCGICGSVCPAKAISHGSGRASIDRKKCITCYCCDEMCPHGAIILRKGLISRLWPWG